MKRIFSTLTAIICIFILAACGTKISLEVKENNLTLVEGEKQTLTITTNDKLGYNVTSLDTSVATINDNAEVTAVSFGSTKVKITSKTDDKKYVEVTVNVAKKVLLDIDGVEGIQWVGETYQLNVTSNDTVTYKSLNESVATVTNTGLVTYIKAGSVEIEVKSVTDPLMVKKVAITVYDKINTIILQGPNKANVGSKNQLELTVAPLTSIADIKYELSDNSLATITPSGEITFLKSGTLTIKAVALNNENIFSELVVEIINEIIVDKTKKAGDSVEVDSLTYQYGSNLFASITEALSKAQNDTIIKVLKGEYDEAITIDKDGINLIGEADVIIKNIVIINADNILITAITFTDKAIIKNNSEIKNITISNSKFMNIQEAVKLIDVDGVKLESNTFENITEQAVSITNILSGDVIVDKNIIKQSKNAITLQSNKDLLESNIKVTANEIKDITTGIFVDIKDTKLTYVRFNRVSNYTTFAAKTNTLKQVDFTLNYWGVSEFDLTKFENIDDANLIGHYKTESSVPKTDITSNEALKAIINNPISELELGEFHRLTWTLLPYGTTSTRVGFITNNAAVITPTSSGYLEGKMTGVATISIRIGTTVHDTVTISVTTDPGIELTPSNKEQGLVVGDKLKMSTLVFPYTMVNETVLFESSNTNILTISETGDVELVGEGIAIIKAKLASDPNVYTEYYLTVYGELDENNLLDQLTLNQFAYSQAYNLHVNGIGQIYSLLLNESVSKYYFDEIVVDTSLMVDKYAGRPGLRPNLPSSVTKYNPENIHWIVVHETANGAPGAGAFTHAMLLYNKAKDKSNDTTSWHYTVDHKLMYQHIPDNEIAYHAGDGSTVPGGNGQYAGGGNRFGIGIEMSVAQYEDIYRTWQRTAKFAAQTAAKYNLPASHVKFHQDFSGKTCPNVLLNARLMDQFREFVQIEHNVAKNHPGAEISFESNNPEYLDNSGRIIKLPKLGMNVTYTITVTEGGNTQSRLFTTYIPGTTK